MKTGSKRAAAFYIVRMSLSMHPLSSFHFHTSHNLFLTFVSLNYMRPVPKSNIEPLSKCLYHSSIRSLFRVFHAVALFRFHRPSKLSNLFLILALRHMGIDINGCAVMLMAHNVTKQSAVRRDSFFFRKDP